MLSVIGVHAGVHTSRQHLVSFGDGHAWLTLHYTNGRSESVGLWPGGMRTKEIQPRMFLLDPIGVRSDTIETFDVVFGLERANHYVPLASRYYGLYSDQSSKAILALGQYTGWRLTHNCSTWATEKIKEIFGHSLASQEFIGITNTPRALAEAIKVMESSDPTSVAKPKYPR